MSLISAERFNELKARVKAECTRRAYAGAATGSISVADYAGTDYDYTVEPASGTTIRQEHRDKIATPLNAINSGTIPMASGQLIISDDDLLSMETFTTTLESRRYSDSSGTDCSGGCTGMCYGCQGTCYDSCSGCGDSCSNNCSGDCGGDCQGNCYGCGSGCNLECAINCEGGCKSTCVQVCAANCRSGIG